MAPEKLWPRLRGNPACWHRTQNRRVLHPLVVEHEPLDQELFQADGGPLAELRATEAADAVADGQDGREAVVLERACRRARALLANL